LFLDEITEIPAKSQVDLLRVLETGQFTRVGGEQPLVSDARIVSATNQNIAELVAEGTFREDLYYRLNIVPIEVPPLRKRRDDIPLLVDHFLNHFCERHGRGVKHVAAETMDVLTDAPWPGNIRQLRNVIERVVITTIDDTIHPNDLPKELSQTAERSSRDVVTLVEVIEAAEKAAIESSLAANDFHREKTAKALGISVRTLHYKMNRYNLH
jgi:DNA-binding NtrC family response regulator